MQSNRIVVKITPKQPRAHNRILRPIFKAFQLNAKRNIVTSKANAIRNKGIKTKRPNPTITLNIVYHIHFSMFLWGLLLFSCNWHKNEKET